MKANQNTLEGSPHNTTGTPCQKVNCPEHPETNLRLAKAIFGSASAASHSPNQSNETRAGFKTGKGYFGPAFDAELPPRHTIECLRDGDASVCPKCKPINDAHRRVTSD